MNHVCVHKNFGTLLYKRGGDLLTSLSWALGASALEEGPDYIGTKPVDGDASILSKAGYIVNNKIHNELVRLSKCKYPEKFSLDEEIEKMDLSLWGFLQSVTLMVRERQKGILEDTKSKQIRRYYLYCLMMYCANTQQPLFFPYSSRRYN